jgi:hypothetical protein
MQAQAAGSGQLKVGRRPLPRWLPPSCLTASCMWSCMTSAASSLLMRYDHSVLHCFMTSETPCGLIMDNLLQGTCNPSQNAHSIARSLAHSLTDANSHWKGILCSSSCMTTCLLHLPPPPSPLPPPQILWLLRKSPRMALTRGTQCRRCSGGSSMSHEGTCRFGCPAGAATLPWAMSESSALSPPSRYGQQSKILSLRWLQ